MGSMVKFSPIQVLDSVIDRLRGQDPLGFFEEPVTDAEAPNYSQVIDNPMCFQRMSEKVRSRAYTTWGAFVRDFELICANAMEYNQRRSKVHKAALQLQRQGKLDLEEMELDARLAIYLLHPGGPSEAMADEVDEAEELGQPKPLNAFLHCPGKYPLPLSPPEAEQVEPDVDSYSCFSGTDEEDTRGWGPVGPADMERFLHNLDEGVAWEPWSSVHGEVEEEDEGAEGDEEGRAKKRKGAADEREDDTSLPEDWQEMCRSVQWRCRWLELRLRALRAQKQHYSFRCQGLTPTTSQSLPCSSPVGSGPFDNMKKSSTTEACPRDGGHLKRKLQRSEIPDLQRDRILHHPFFSLHCGVGKLGKKPREKETEENGSNMTTPGAQSGDDAGGFTDSDDECYAARAHAALGILGEEAKRLINLVQARRKVGQSLPPKPTPLRPQKSQRSISQPKPRISRPDQTKRARSVNEADDLSIGIGTLSGAPSIERPPKHDISVPSVSRLPDEEIEQREKAIKAWRALLLEDPTTSVVPEEVVAALQNVQDQSSDSEATSDEAFLTRHKAMESSEQERHMVVFGPQKKNKTDSKGVLGSKKAPQAKGMQEGHGLGMSAGFPGQRPLDSLEGGLSRERMAGGSVPMGALGSAPSTTAVCYGDESGVRARGRPGRKTGRPRGRPPQIARQSSGWNSSIELTDRSPRLSAGTPRGTSANLGSIGADDAVGIASSALQGVLGPSRTDIDHAAPSDKLKTPRTPLLVKTHTAVHPSALSVGPTQPLLEPSMLPLGPLSRAPQGEPESSSANGLAVGSLSCREPSTGPLGGGQLQLRPPVTMRIGGGRDPGPKDLGAPGIETIPESDEEDLDESGRSGRAEAKVEVEIGSGPAVTIGFGAGVSGTLATWSSPGTLAGFETGGVGQVAEHRDGDK
ncbi:unnamed protein product [Ostreobium quekettii]|uniref:Bromo domain-containing protein n=1 Tax=Ostreobium quekettii TaxID=121088 RepID=A0A8S1IZJ0_9CHLO|nr:unnamed protein product [Ostreobium quekettii]|eukprot:evm.model.scf_397.6 EVM.evm.TU.scf_397.6   scf_397:49680-57112(-)